MAHYHIYADLNLGIGEVSVQRIICGCSSCLEKLRTKWDTEDALSPEQPPRFLCNRKCKCSDIFSSLNDWKILELKSTYVNDKYDLNNIKADILGSIIIQITSEIKSQQKRCVYHKSKIQP